MAWARDWVSDQGSNSAWHGVGVWDLSYADYQGLEYCLDLYGRMFGFELIDFQCSPQFSPCVSVMSAMC